MVTSYFLEAIRKAKPIPESPAPITAIFLCFAGRLYLLGLLRVASSMTDFSSRLICSWLSIIWRMQAFSQYAGHISHTIAGKATLSRIDLYAALKRFFVILSCRSKISILKGQASAHMGISCSLHASN